MIFGVGGVGRIDLDAAVVAQRRIDRQPPRRGLDHEPLQPFVGHEIEQRRGGDQIDRAVERGFEVAVEIDRHGGDVDVRRG